jgi:hypothetical protein
MVDSDLPALPPKLSGPLPWLKTVKPLKRGPSADNIEGDQRAAKRTKFVPLSEATEIGKADETARDIEDFDVIIIVLVGPEECRFSLHKIKLCSKSKFFRAACSERWIEGQEKLVRLPEVKVEVFRVYCEWIYNSNLPTIRCTAGDKETEKAVERNQLAHLYLLGDSLDDLELRRAATQAIFTFLRARCGIFTVSTFAIVWSSTPPGNC